MRPATLCLCNEVFNPLRFLESFVRRNGGNTSFSNGGAVKVVTITIKVAALN